MFANDRNREGPYITIELTYHSGVHTIEDTWLLNHGIYHQSIVRIHVPVLMCLCMLY